MHPILRSGMRSQMVSDLQKHLNRFGAALQVDGRFGQATKSGVQAFQIHVGLVNDGIAGPKTLAALFKDSCVHEQKNELLAAAAHRLQTPLASLYAVCEVETNGQGFLANGEPVILFERHVMYRQLIIKSSRGKEPGDRRTQVDRLASLHLNLINLYPGGYLGGIHKHQRLNNARLIDEDAALQSTSRGTSQLMGFHWRQLNYTSIQEFVRTISREYSYQVDALIGFIESDKILHNALRARDWAKLARHYSGPGYQRNQYDVKLQQRYEQHVACGCSARIRVNEAHTNGLGAPQAPASKPSDRSVSALNAARP